MSDLNPFTDAVDALAEATGCPIVLEDPEFHVLAYSAIPDQPDDPVRSDAILRRRTPSKWLDWLAGGQGGRDHLAEGEVMEVADVFPGLRKRAVKALTAEDGIIGYVWILQGHHGFPSTLRHQLNVFEGFAVPELQRTRLGSAEDQETRLVQRLTSTALPPDTLQADGIDPGSRVGVSILGAPQDAVLDRDDLKAAVTHIRPAGRLPGRTVLVGIIERRICRLDYVSRTGTLDLDSPARAAQRIAGHWSRGVVLGQSRIHPATSTHAAWIEARNVVDVLRPPERGARVACFEEVQYALLLAHVVNCLRDRPELTRCVDDALNGAGAQGVSGQRQTVLAYLRHSGSIPRAAEELRIHPNTMRYRLERLGAVLNLHDPVTRLALEVTALSPDDLANSGRVLDPR